MKKLLPLLFAWALVTSMVALAGVQTVSRQVVATKDAPQAIGPYSQAIKAAGLVFASGQIALDPATGKL